jgi:pilus assembly protein CpaC
MIKTLKTLFLAGGLMLAVLSPAWATGAGPADELRSTEAVSISPTETLNIVLEEGKLLQLPAPAVSVFVATPDVADVQVKSGSVLYIFGRAPGTTSFYAVDADDNVIASRTINVGYNLAGLRASIRQLTKSDMVQASQVQDMLLLSGQVPNATMAQDILRMALRYLPRNRAGLQDINTETILQNMMNIYIINRMQIMSSNQVNIRVRIAEVSRNAIKSLGIGTSVENPNLFGDVDVGFGFDNGIALTGAAGTAGLATTWGATSISAALDALVSDGNATILAEPNLTALSGETASFLAGGEFPIPVPDDGGTTTIQFRQFGVTLSFTPTVLDGDRISMRVRPEVSQRDDSGAVSFAGGSIPGLITRRAETSVELGSGQSISIAGLLQNTVSQAVDKYPGLGDIPILGALFRSDRYRRAETELVIVVTPYLVKPVNSNQIMLPTDGYVPPNDIDRWLNGRLNSEVPTPAPVSVSKTAGSVAADGGLVGDVGFVVQ